MCVRRGVHERIEGVKFACKLMSYVLSRRIDGVKVVLWFMSLNP